eukprot:jgi/Astpho2/8776/fgenesh1_pm.00128_%23_15_t
MAGGIMTDFEKIKRIGEGTYGVCYKARNRNTGEIVALKALRMDRERDGLPVTSVRELRVLQSCKHPNLVNLLKVVTGSKLDSVFLVFEYCAHDLGRLLDTMRKPFSEPEVKCLMLQLLSAVAYLHQNWVVHRDLKLSNLLLTSDGRLKLCDFGLARYFRAYEEPMTPRVVTLWYRAPEVLLGMEAYTEAIDMWACGCIMGELLKHEPLFPTRTDIQTLEAMSRLLGAPNDHIWPAFSSLPNAAGFKFPAQPYNLTQQSFPRLGKAGLELLNGLLTYDPSKRLTARRALRHRWFQEAPLPVQPAEMPKFRSAHDADTEGSRTHKWRVEADDDESRVVKMAQRAADRFGDAFDPGR